MTIGELLLTNKQKYTKAFIIKNDKDNKAVFTEVSDENIEEDLIMVEAKDYFLLDRDTVDDIFGNAEELNLSEDDLSLIMGI